MTRPTTTGKAQDLITFTRSTTGTALAKISYGEEVVTNGDFASDSDWGYAPIRWRWSSGRIERHDGSGNDPFYQSFNIVEGKTYKITYDVEYVSGGSTTNVFIDTGAGFITPVTINGSGTAVGYFTAQATKLLQFQIYAIGTFRGFVDNVSVKEVLYDQPDGTLQLFNHPINKPRIEYDASGNCLGLLVEEARTNSQANSENIDAAWSQKASGRTEVLSNQITAPDGTSSADLIQAIDGSSSGEQYARRFISSISSTSTLSVFVRKKNWRYIAIRLINHHVFDFDTEAFTVGSGTIQKLHNGWYRLSVTDAAGGSAFVGVGTASNANVIPWPTAPQNNEGVYVWGAQLEAGSFPTSYIPTSGSAITRAADLASLAVSEFGYNQDQFSVVVESDLFGGTTLSTLCYIGENTSNRILFYYASRNLSYQIKSSSATQASKSLSGRRNKAAYRYKLNDMNLAGNGDTTVADTSANLINGTPNNIYIGSYYNGSNLLNGHIKSVQYYPLGLSNAQLQALTV